VSAVAAATFGVSLVDSVVLICAVLMFREDETAAGWVLLVSGLLVLWILLAMLASTASSSRTPRRTNM
jgi:hypothetical protein